MNFLAHCALAHAADPTQPALIAGGVLGDFIRGPVPASWPEPLQRGVRLHRRIDAFSNALPGIRESCSHFPTALRRFAPIFVDIHGDRALSLQWQAHHDMAIEAFSAHSYRALASSIPSAPEVEPRAGRFLSYMQDENLLSCSHEWAHVERALASVCRRLKREHLTEAAIAAVRDLDETLCAQFAAYYPALREEAARFSASFSAAR